MRGAQVYSAYGTHVTEWRLGISVVRTSDIDSVDTFTSSGAFYTQMFQVFIVTDRSNGSASAGSGRSFSTPTTYNGGVAQPSCLVAF